MQNRGEKMELTKRKQDVLEAIIRAYIATGEPVGSKILTGIMENAPSSATLRNEMSELCELGLLEQPHISAGRIPTNDAYKLFDNSYEILHYSDYNHYTDYNHCNGFRQVPYNNDG